jgi:hypothetical protein
MRRYKTEAEIKQRIAKLVENPSYYLDSFEEAKKFTGPSLYFHYRTVQRLAELGKPSIAVKDQTFLEYLYATLTAWGLHRMGPGGAKLVSFEEFSSSLEKQSERFDHLSTLRIESLDDADSKRIIESLWDITENIEVSATESKLVAGSKVLHHVLPTLVPPIDREYTANFFLWRNQMQYRQQEMFFDVFPRLVDLAKAVEAQCGVYLGRGFNTSLPKLVDNLIMGFLISERGVL